MGSEKGTPQLDDIGTFAGFRPGKETIRVCIRSPAWVLEFRALGCRALGLALRLQTGSWAFWGKFPALGARVWNLTTRVQEPQGGLWEFPKIGDPSIVSYIVGSLA